MKNILAIFLLFASATAYTQNLSNKGREFWVGYGHHQFMEPGQNNSQEMVLYFSAEQAATVTVRIWGTTWIRTYNVPAGQVIASDLIPKSGTVDARLISLPCSFVPPGTPCGGEGKFTNKAIQITSDVPIVAYAHIYGSASSGASMLMPEETWGFQYTSVNSQQQYAANCFSWLYVIAKENNTVIEVTPTVTSRTGKPASVPYTVTLNKGEIYQTMAGPEGASTKDHMTGTKIRSIANAAGECYPVAVFSGSSRTSNPAPCGSGGGDNDNQQLFPTQAWGKRYLTAPTSSSTGAANKMKNTFKIVIKEPGTKVFRNGVQLTGILQNSYYYYESNTEDYIEADKPIMVAQFMTGGTNCMNGGVGDPEMIIISPLEQGIKRIGFYRNNEENITVNYLTLIIHKDGVPSLRIDNSATFDYTYTHSRNTDYRVVIKRWGSTKAQATAFSDSAFTAITYGLGSVESYGYNAGTLINNLAVEGEMYNVADSSTADTVRQYTCIGTPMKLTALVAYKPNKMVWRLSTIPQMSPNTDVTVDNPVILDSLLIGQAMYYRYGLPGTYTFSDTGSFLLPIRNTHPAIENCYQTEEVKIEIKVRPSPFTNLGINHSGCITDTVYFTSSTDGGNGHNVYKWDWSFGDATTSTLQNPTKLYATPGTYTINLKVFSQEGCVGDTSRSLVIGDRPLASILASPLTACEGVPITFTDTTSNSTTGTWYWDFGNGQVVNATTNAPQTVTYPLPGTYTVKHMFKTSATCVSDTVSQVVTVYAKPSAGFTYGGGCLPPGGSVQFTDTSSATGQTITGWKWNFGDPGSGANDSSNLQNPTHIFSASGNYNITLTVTTNNGCTNTKTVAATFNYAPVLTLTPDTAICSGQSATLTVGGATTYAWSPSTGLSSTTGSTVTANPTDTTTYQVVGTTNGCTDTATVTVTVNPLPAKPVTGGNITYCQNNTATPLTATALPGHSLTWYNNPGLTGGTATAPTPVTTTQGTFDYFVTQTNTTTGCVSDTAKITVMVAPEIANNTVSSNQSICAGSASAILNGATPTGGDGNYTYQWQASTDGGATWTDIAGATSANYDPQVVNNTTSYRRIVNSGLCTNTSASVTISVTGVIFNTSITADQTICANAAPALLDGETATGGNGTFVYAWESSPDNYTWTNIAGATGEDFQPPALTTTTYYRRKTTSDTCTVISSPVTIAVNPEPTGAITGPSAICSYDAAAVTFNATVGTAPFNVQLQVTTPGGGVNTINQVIPDNGPATINVIPVNSAGGTYTVTLQSITDNNCSRTTGFSPVTIVVTAQPNVTVAAPAPVCEGSSVTLTASGADTYQWSPSTGLSSTTGSTVTANPVTTTTYQVVGTTNGCSDTTQVTVTINPRPTKPAATTPVVYCEADAAATLSGTPDAGHNLTWYDNSALINGSATPPTPSTTTAGTVYYYVTQTNAGGCESDTARIAVTVNPKPTLSFTLPSAICKGDEAMFTNNSFVSDNSGLTYAWDFGDGNTSNGMSPTHTYATYNSFNITLSATSGYGCQDQITQTLPASAFYDSPVVDFSSAGTVCQNESTGFTNLSTAPNSTITSALWSFGDGSTSTQTNPDKTYSRPGTFTVKLEATNAQGCKAEFSKDIVVYLQPVVDAGRSFVVPQGTIVQFEPSVNDTTLSFLWTPSADFADPTKLRQVLTVNKDETYTLSVTGQGGCVASDFMTVKVQKPIEIPNSFSPNGDGIFDTWIIKNINDYQGASVEVYNRYGQQVFYSVGYNRPWDGTMSGKPVPFGTYYYVVKLKNGFQPMTGSVTIIR